MYTSLSLTKQPVFLPWAMASLQRLQQMQTFFSSRCPFSKMSRAKSGYAKAMRPKPANETAPLEMFDAAAKGA